MRPQIWGFHGVSINGGTPIAGWFIKENPAKMDDLGVPPIRLFSPNIIIYLLDYATS